MPRYTLQVADGRKVTLDAPDDRTAMDAAAGWAKSNPHVVTHTSAYDRSRATADTMLSGTGEHATNLLNGLTFNNADRVQGGLAAVGAFLRNVAGDKSVNPAEAYAATRDATRAHETAFGKAHPVVKFGEELAGGAPIGEGVGGLVGTGANVAQKIGRAVLSGGLVGAAYGAGGDKDNPLRGAAYGGASGEALGVGVPAAAKAARGVASAVRPQATVGALSRGERLAAAVLAKRNGGTLPTDLAPTHPNALPLDHSSRMTDLAEVAAQSPGPARDTISQALQARDANAGDRIQAAIGDTFGADGRFLRRRQTITDLRARQARPFYDKAFNTPLDQAKYDRYVKPALATVDQEAIDKGAKIAQREGEADQQLTFRPGINGEVTLDHAPNLRTLHYVKQGLDAQIAAHKNAMGVLDTSNPEVRGLVGVRQRLGDALNRASPNYAQGNQIFSGHAKVLDALNLGRGVLTGDGNVDRSAEALGMRVRDMSAAERDMFRNGVGEALVAQARSGKGGVTAMRQLLRSQEFQDRVRLAFPSSQKYDRFIGDVEREVGFKNNMNQVLGNSATMRRSAARADLDVDSVLGQAVEFAGDTAAHGPQGAVKRALYRAVASRVPGTTQNVLDNPEANATLGRVLTSRDAASEFLQRAQPVASTRSVAASPAIAARTRNLAVQAAPTLIAGYQQ